MNGKDVTPKLSLFHLSWPMFIEEITGGITAFTDILFISMISDEAAASVGMLSPVLLLGYFILPQFTSAGTSVASQYMGAGQKEKVVPTWIGNVLISTIIGSGLAAVLFLLSGRIGLWLGMSSVQNGYAEEYMSIIAFNFILVGIRFSYSSILASKTLTRWNMAASVTTNIINIPLNWMLMNGIWIFPAMGIKGIALATVISYCIGFFIVFYFVHIRLKISFIISNMVQRVREVILPIMRIGVPSALEPFSYTAQNFIVSFLIIGYGLTAMGANTYVYRLLFVDLTVSWTLTMSGQILMSHHLGAGNIDAVKRIYRRIAFLSTGFACVNLLVYLSFHRQFLGLFTSNETIIDTGFWILVIALFMEPIRSINILGGVALKTVGDGKFSVIIGLLFMWGVVPVIIFVSNLGMGIIGLWLCLLADETIRAGINLWRWNSGKWAGKRVIGY